MKTLILLLLLPGLVLGGTPPSKVKNDVEIDQTINSYNTRTVDRSNNTDVDVSLGDTNVNTDISVRGGDLSATASVSGNNSEVNFQDSASTAYAYAAQCGTSGGASTREFSLSQSGESQYCKHLRIAAFYEGLYLEAKGRLDNVMAQVWYNSMVGEINTAQSLIDSTSFTGSMKETAGDLLMPTLLCGGLAVVTAGVYGAVCATGLVIKAKHDQDKLKDRYDTAIQGLEVRDTNHVEQNKPVCAYVDGRLSQEGSCLAN